MSIPKKSNNIIETFFINIPILALDTIYSLIFILNINNQRCSPIVLTSTISLTQHLRLPTFQQHVHEQSSHRRKT
jgi:hypothetical protein